MVQFQGPKRRLRHPKKPPNLKSKTIAMAVIEVIGAIEAEAEGGVTAPEVIAGVIGIIGTITPNGVTSGITKSPLPAQSP